MPDFEAMTKAQIAEYATKTDIELNMAMTKAEMITILQKDGE